jgi:hypothetical protein
MQHSARVAHIPAKPLTLLSVDSRGEEKCWHFLFRKRNSSGNLQSDPISSFCFSFARSSLHLQLHKILFPPFAENIIFYLAQICRLI